MLLYWICRYLITETVICPSVYAKPPLFWEIFAKRDFFLLDLTQEGLAQHDFLLFVDFVRISLVQREMFKRESVWVGSVRVALKALSAQNFHSSAGDFNV